MAPRAAALRPDRRHPSHPPVDHRDRHLRLRLHRLDGLCVALALADAAPRLPLRRNRQLRAAFEDFRFQADIRNTIVFTALFLLSATVLGFLAAALLDQKIKGEAFFRGEFLFPMAISFIVTGIVWQWLFHPSSGLNLLSRKAGYDGPVPAWSTDANVLFGLDLGKIEAGIRLRSCRSSWRRRGTSPASRWSAMPTRRRLRSSRPALKKRCARRTT